MARPVVRGTARTDLFENRERDQDTVPDHEKNGCKRHATPPQVDKPEGDGT